MSNLYTPLVPIPPAFKSLEEVSRYLQSLTSSLQHFLLSIQQEVNLNIHGFYTPTLTGVANVNASTAYITPWLRVGKLVIVVGAVTVDPTAGATLTQLGISLPIATTLDVAGNCRGTASLSSPAVGVAGVVYRDVTNDRAQLDFTSSGTVDETWSFVFGYYLE